MNTERQCDINEFIERCKKPEVRNIIHESAPIYSSTKWGRKNRDKLKESQKKYEESEKGKEAIVRRRKTRNERTREASSETCWIEKKDIRKFYMNTPDGYEVDHIIPIAAGGKHCISNLRYLKPEENRIKSSNLNGVLMGKWRGKPSKYLNKD